MNNIFLFSVIVPTCNRIDMLRMCLDCISPGKQSLDLNYYEVIVSDDGTMPVDKITKSDYPWVKWVKGPCSGPAANRNEAVKHASGEWLIFTDDDCLPDVMWLSSYKNAIVNSNAKAFEGAIHPRGEMREDFVECPVNLTGGLFWSANICIRKDAFTQVGGFDENFLIAAQEDQDLFLKIKKLTHVIFIKDAIVFHPVRKAELLKSIKKINQRSLNWLYYAKKNKKALNYKSNFSIIKEGYLFQFRASYNSLKRIYIKQFLYSIAMLVYGMPLIIIHLILIDKLKNRKFQWISSTAGDIRHLELLDKRLAGYYTLASWRDTYQQMLGKEPLPKKGDFSELILNYILKSNSQNIIDIGCSNGRIFRHLRQLGFKGKYTGIEVASYLIESNKNNHPDAGWATATAYQIPYPDDSFDLGFAFFVIEHLVYPEKGLTEMMRILKKNGELVLIFPDFVESKRLSSQQLGFSPNDTAIQKIKKFKIADAVISLYDSRFKLPKALKGIYHNVGEFPVNLNPICFNSPDSMSPDFDAVYIASKEEVAAWATKKGYKVSFPYGREGELSEKVFMTITK